MCKKQSSVSHSSTESEVISLDAGLRLDGNPVLDPWDLVKEVLHYSKKFRHREIDHAKTLKAHTQTNPNPEVGELSKLDHVVTRATLSYFEASCWFCFSASLEPEMEEENC